MPMTTWVGRKPAISSASWSATAQLSTTAAMSATVPDCMWRQALALAPDAADGAVAVVVDLEDERLRELGPDVERGAGGQRLAARRAARSGARRPFSLPLRRGGRGSPPAPRPQPVAGGAPALGHLRPAAAAAVDRRHRRRLTRSPADDAARDEVVADRHEQLRLVGVERRARSRPSRARRGRPSRTPLSASIDSNGPAYDDEPDARRDLVAPAPRARPASARRAAATRPSAAAASRAARPGARAIRSASCVGD